MSVGYFSILDERNDSERVCSVHVVLVLDPADEGWVADQGLDHFGGQFVRGDVAGFGQPVEFAVGILSEVWENANFFV